ncbi:MAG TPA: 2-isopropylmalate synthase [Anaerolineales bacterium]|nr:2-isopropylmalate synthase [Anaerolineales bacterium]
MDNYVRIFDTTLRDGEQSPGASMTSAEKIEVARALARLGVDIIEAGFAAASPDDLEAIRRISREVSKIAGARGEPPVICSLARANKGDIDKAWLAVQDAPRPRIHTFLATSEIHMKYKLKMDPEEVVDRVVNMVGYARSLCTDVEFSPEDAGRSDPKFLYVVLEQAIKAGATTLNIPDTVGYTTPDEYGALIRGIVENVPGVENVILSTHCHDDLGLATANTLAGIRNGARQVEVTINGIGERAGNTSLEEVVMALQTRRPVFGLSTGIDTTHLVRVSRLVSNYTSIVVPPNKAIVGANAFAHEAGIHQDGMLKNQETYEIMRPETVGAQNTRLVLGKHSGRHALKARLLELGYELSDADLDKAFERFKTMADKKKVITDADLEALVSDELLQSHEFYKLDDMQVASGTIGMPTATVRLIGPDGQKRAVAAIGTGPVDAVYKAIDQIVQVPATLLEFSVHAVTEGIDAVGEVSVRVSANELPGKTMTYAETERVRSYGGYGADTDIIVASAKAYLSALNKVLITSRGGD